MRSARPSAKRRRSSTDSKRSAFALRPWHVVSMLWSQLANALLPIPWADLRGFLDRFVSQLLRPNVKVRPRQIDRLRVIILRPAGAG